MEAEVYPDPEVSRFVTEHFVPVKIHVKEQPQQFDRFRAQWTPTQLVMDEEGVERHRIEGFLPKDDFLAQLEIGLARVALERKNLADAQRMFREVSEHHPKSFAAAEATYWAGVALYKENNSGDTLRQTYQELMSRYPESEWAKKAAVWAG